MPSLTKAQERLLSDAELPSPQELMTFTGEFTIQGGGMAKREKSRQWSSMLRLPTQDPRAVIVGSLAAII